jgi:hypothetical protein
MYQTKSASVRVDRIVALNEPAQEQRGSNVRISDDQVRTYMTG